MEDQLFRRTAAGKGGDLVERLVLCKQIPLFLIYLHGIPQRAGGSRNDRDLMHRSGVALARSNQRVAHLMVGDDLPLVDADTGILLLVSGDNHFHTLLQIFLGYEFSAHTDRAERSLVDDVGEFRAAGARCSQRHVMEIHIVGQLHILSMYLQDRLAAAEVRQFHRNAPVKTARTQQRLIERVRAVGRRQNYDALLSIEAVHLGQKLV